MVNIPAILLCFIWEGLSVKIRKSGCEEKILQSHTYMSVEFWELSNKDIQLCHCASKIRIILLKNISVYFVLMYNIIFTKLALSTSFALKLVCSFSIPVHNVLERRGQELTRPSACCTPVCRGRKQVWPRVCTPIRRGRKEVWPLECTLCRPQPDTHCDCWPRVPLCMHLHLWNF
jgi:hypothetical protein